MATVTVLTFPSVGGADDALPQVEQLQAQHLITLRDAAIVSWPRGAKHPSTRQLVTTVTAGGALGGAFWAMFFGLIFFTPLAGLAVGVAVGPLGGVFREYGIDDLFVRRVRDAVRDGTSALFLMTSDAIVEPLGEALGGVPFNVVATRPSAVKGTHRREACAR